MDDLNFYSIILNTYWLCYFLEEGQKHFLFAVNSTLENLWSTLINSSANYNIWSSSSLSFIITLIPYLYARILKLPNTHPLVFLSRLVKSESITNIFEWKRARANDNRIFYPPEKVEVKFWKGSSSQAETYNILTIF